MNSEDQKTPDCSSCDSDCILAHRQAYDLVREEKAAKVLNYRRNEKIFEAGEPIAGFYIVCRGAAIETAFVGDQKVTLKLFQPQDLLGGDAFLQGKSWHETSTRSISKTKLILLRKEIYPRLGRVAGSRVRKKLGANMKGLRQNLEMAHRSVMEKTAYWVAKLLSGPSSSFRVSNRELSDIVGCSPVTISRKLNKLKDRGLVEKSGQKIQITEPEQLQEIFH